MNRNPLEDRLRRALRTAAALVERDGATSGRLSAFLRLEAEVARLDAAAAAVTRARAIARGA
jgi:hypothetical protein